MNDPPSTDRGRPGHRVSMLRREARVAFSRKAQPLWFRVTKWLVIIGLVGAFRRSPHLGWWLAGALAVAVTLHLVWRWKTRGWTRPWGGWSDLEAGRGDLARAPEDAGNQSSPDGM